MKDNPMPSSFMQTWVSFITLPFVRHLVILLCIVAKEHRPSCRKQ